MSCSYSCSKLILFTVNLIVAICSLSVLFICGLAVANVTNIYEVSSVSGEKTVGLEVPVVPALWVILGVAGLAFILSFMGCCGALRESSCLLYSFSVMLAIILGIQLAVIGFAYYKQDDFRNEINNMMNSTLYDYPRGKDGYVRKSWDALQTDLRCCGINGPKDWSHVFGNDTLPDSCCPVVAAGSTCNIKSDDPVPSNIGCLEAIIGNLDPVFISVLVVAVLEIFGIIVACCLASSISDQYRTV